MQNNLSVQAPKAFDLSPQNFEQALAFAGYLADSSMVPKDFIGKPGNCLVAIQWGMELGMKPLQCMQNIAVINGRPSLWGDAVLALVLASPQCTDVVESYEGSGDTYAAVCIAKRHGRADKVVRFSVADAKAAGLLNKQGPWAQYRDRMLKMRARAFALRDQFADVLKGMAVAEEAMDTPPGERFMGQAVPAAAPAEPVPTYPAEKFAANLAQWQKVIQTGRKTADEIISMAETKHPLTDEQKADIRAVKPVEDAVIKEPQAPAPGPVITFAMVADKLHKAKDGQALDEAADLIGSVADAAQRAELSAMYDQQQAKLEGGAA